MMQRKFLDENQRGRAEKLEAFAEMYKQKSLLLVDKKIREAMEVVRVAQMVARLVNEIPNFRKELPPSELYLRPLSTTRER
mgnify:CR=1 FL=1